MVVALLLPWNQARLARKPAMWKGLVATGFAGMDCQGPHAAAGTGRRGTVRLDRDGRHGFTRNGLVSCGWLGEVREVA